MMYTSNPFGKKPQKLAILGGSGFVGSHLIPRLVADGHQVTLLTRSRAYCGDRLLLPNTRVVELNVYDSDALEEVLTGHDAVINLVGILNESGFGGKGFQRAHVELTRILLAVMQSLGIQRYLHMSALGAGLGTSYYLKTRGQSEALVKQAASNGLDITIYQPSVIFGAGDGFINRFADLLKIALVFPLACSSSRFQPVWVGDVVEAFATTINKAESHGETYQLGGPRVFTLREIVNYCCQQLQVKRLIIPLPKPLSWLQGKVLDFVPGKPFSSDNYKSLQLDSVVTENHLPALGISPRSIETTVPLYLGLGAKRRRIQQSHKGAGR